MGDGVYIYPVASLSHVKVLNLVMGNRRLCTSSCYSSNGREGETDVWVLSDKCHLVMMGGAFLTLEEGRCKIEG